MRRITANLLLLLALVSSLAQIASAISAPPPHACCVRKSHQCHDGGIRGMGQATHDESAAAFQATGCVRGGCCRALTVSQSPAEPKSSSKLTFIDVDDLIADALPHFVSNRVLSAAFVRGPPSV